MGLVEQVVDPEIDTEILARFVGDEEVDQRETIGERRIEIVLAEDMLHLGAEDGAAIEEAEADAAGGALVGATLPLRS